MDSTPTPLETIPAPPETPAPAQPRQWRRWLLIVAALVLAAGIYYYPSVKTQAEAGSAYAARIGCSCRYVQGRDIDSCSSDFEPGMAIVSLNDDAATKTVTGSVPLLASRSARFAGTSGCLLNPRD